MSSAATTWAWAVEIPNRGDSETARYSQKLVLLCLAENTNRDTWEAFQGESTIERRTHLNARVVRRALLDLERHGIIRDTGRRRGRTGRVKVFELLREANPVAESGFTSPQVETSRSEGRSEANPVAESGFPEGGNPDAAGSEIRTLSAGNPDSAYTPPRTPKDVEPSTEPSASTEELPAAPRPERPLDPLIEILCIEAEGAAEGSRSMPASRVRTVAVAASKIRPLGATPEDVHLAIVNWPTHFPGATLTAPAIAEHWARLQRPGPNGVDGRQARRGRSIAADEDWSDIPDEAWEDAKAWLGR